MEQQSPENHGNDRKGIGDAYESGYRGTYPLIQGSMGVLLIWDKFQKIDKSELQLKLIINTYNIKV